MGTNNYPPTLAPLGGKLMLYTQKVMAPAGFTLKNVPVIWVGLSQRAKCIRSRTTSFMHPMYFAVGTHRAELIKVNQSTKQVFISNHLMMLNQNFV